MEDELHMLPLTGSQGLRVGRCGNLRHMAAGHPERRVASAFFASDTLGLRSDISGKRSKSPVSESGENPQVLKQSIDGRPPTMSPASSDLLCLDVAQFVCQWIREAPETTNRNGGVRLRLVSGPGVIMRPTA